MIPDDKPTLHPITTTFQPNPTKTPHSNNRKQIQHVDPIDQLKYLDGEDSKYGWYQIWFCYTNFADAISLVLVY
jgi:hypothetical protein